tara:strand:- start:56 stop:469 length:414 start_codon:yes stop_codon:yes gene_type:complete
MQEFWVLVKGFEQYYEVSSLGRVRSLAVVREHPRGPRRFPSRLLTNKRGKAKYVKTQLFGAPGQFREVRLHVLVAEHFIQNPNNLPNACHKDDNPDNNAASNLVWGTHSDNAKQAITNGKWEGQKAWYRRNHVQVML